MKKLIASLLLCCLAGTASHAQKFITLVPSTAALVIKYSGENFSKSVPAKKLDSYGFIKDVFFKNLHINTPKSLQDMGIYFEEDCYQYVIKEDTCLSFVSLLHLKNEAQFLKFIKVNYGSSKKIIKKKDFSFLPISETTYIAWNKNKAVIVNTDYQNRNSYYNNYYSTDATVNVDTAVAEVLTVDSTVTIPEMKVETDSVEVLPSTENTETENQYEENRIRDSINSFKYELWQQQQDLIAKKQQQVAAEKIIDNSFSGKIHSIENDLSYSKITDAAAHISVWLNTESIISQYTNYFYKGAFNMLGVAPDYNTDTTDGFKSAVNMYFEKDKLRMEQKTFSADPKLGNLAVNVMNSKQNTALVNYVNPDNIGYLAMSVNTEAMANYYYTFLKNYLSTTPYMSDYADLVDVYIDLMEIIIDEKEIAQLLPGNYLFVMHDMKPQIVDYTDYEYDSEFNKKEVKKSRKELSPDFTFAMETKKDGFMQKVAHLPLKYAEKGGYNYSEKDGYYELAFEKGKYPISSLFFMVKDGKVIVTTSKDVINMTIGNTAFTIDAATKNSILNNNYSLNINSKRLIEKLGTQVSTDVNKKISEYLLANMGNIKMESRIKDGMIQGTTTFDITGNHTNSLEFFFNMMDAINNIIEKDKQEQQKTLY